MGLTGWLGFVSIGVSPFKQQKRVSFSARRVGQTCRTAIPGLEWLLFFGLIKGFGTGNQHSAPPQEDGSSDASVQVRPIKFDEDVITEDGMDISRRGAEECKCGSELRYEDCCRPIHLFRRRAETPADLLKARFSAYAYNLPGLKCGRDRVPLSVKEERVSDEEVFTSMQNRVHPHVH
uniref:Uncharacterized protein n=1 Tax=Rhodosorus marinus TaxID=101924 RepID=A0A6T6L1L5_9RHOD|mmetsp:Transcript_15091/g.22197  ORF Transcript_15091/g.22197 Transcript_15091/m.22197 type:complete len:178 (+) Transcript_15091:137-670(+)